MNKKARPGLGGRVALLMAQVPEHSRRAGAISNGGVGPPEPRKGGDAKECMPVLDKECMAEHRGFPSRKKKKKNAFAQNLSLQILQIPLDIIF